MKYIRSYIVLAIFACAVVLVSLRPASAPKTYPDMDAVLKDVASGEPIVLASFPLAGALVSCVQDNHADFPTFVLIATSQTASGILLESQSARLGLDHAETPQVTGTFAVPPAKIDFVITQRATGYQFRYTLA